MCLLSGCWCVYWVFGCLDFECACSEVSVIVLWVYFCRFRMLWRCWYACHTEVLVVVKPTLVMGPEFLLLFLTNSMRRFVFIFVFKTVFCTSNLIYIKINFFLALL
jgi:hypothetical protein